MDPDGRACESAVHASDGACEHGESLGARLRHWRRLRGMSQLTLATEAATTARHVSFLETGRSRPSRAMVIRLSDVLGLPLRERNRLLEAAGLAAAYREAALDSATLAPYRAAIERLLGAHEPYPAMVVDGRYRYVSDAAASARQLHGNGWHSARRRVMLAKRSLLLLVHCDGAVRRDRAYRACLDAAAGTRRESVGRRDGDEQPCGRAA
jgi:transcriptional regulator with XRE-family HTH domain